MSRGNPGETYVIKPTNNIYTVLVLIALLVSILAGVVIYMKANTYFPPSGLFNADQDPPASHH